MTTMITYFLKFPDETVAQSRLTDAGLYVEPIGNNPGYYKQAGIGWAFDPIGTITEGGVWDPETGEELVPPTVLDGWHANYIGESLPQELEAFVLNSGPTSPYRVFA